MAQTSSFALFCRFYTPRVETTKHTDRHATSSKLSAASQRTSSQISSNKMFLDISKKNMTRGNFLAVSNKNCQPYTFLIGGLIICIRHLCESLRELVEKAVETSHLFPQHTRVPITLQKYGKCFLLLHSPLSTIYPPASTIYPSLSTLQLRKFFYEDIY